MTDSEKLDLLLETVGGIKTKVDSLDKRVDSLDKRVDSLDKRVDSLDKKVNVLDEKVDSLDEKVDSLDKRMGGLETEVSKVKMTLENETNRNIRIIAEGHLDLSRKLNECIYLSSEIKSKQEINDILIGVHDNRLKALS